MPIQKPSPAQIAALAAEIGYSSIAAAPEEYTAIITGLLGVYDAVDTSRSPQVLAGRAAVTTGAFRGGGPAPRVGGPDVHPAAPRIRASSPASGSG